MLYPALGKLNQTREFTQEFKGLDRRPRAGAGYFFDMRNMGAEESVVIKTRKLRSIVTKLEHPQGMCAMDRLLWVDNGTLYDGGDATEITGLSEGMKTMIRSGAYIIIMPDGAYYNCYDENDYGYINREWSMTASADAKISMQICRIDGTEFDAGEVTVSDTAPEEPEDGKLWINTGLEKHAMYRWSAVNQEWVNEPSVYVKIAAEDIGKGLFANDVADISGLTYTGESAVMEEQVKALNGSYLIIAAGNDYIVVTGILDEVYEQQSGTAGVNRTMPVMDFVIECNNRLWGCRHGMTGGEMINEIYASALGDFRNWRRYGTEAGDSYAMSCGTEGDFTGAINYRGYPVFFKENWCYKVYGEKPSNYQAQIQQLEGVKDGCSKSLQTVNGSMFYCGRNGINLLDSMPTDYSEQLGNRRWRNAVAGEWDYRYYISMQDENDEWGLYVMDTRRGYWYKQDDLQALDFARMADSFYVLRADGTIIDLNGIDGDTKETPEELDWMIETPDEGYQMPDHKYLSRYNLRIKLGPMTACVLLMQYDGDGIWHKKGTLVSRDAVRSYDIPVLPQRCDHVRMRLVGKGEMTLYGIDRIVTRGADANARPMT